MAVFFSADPFVDPLIEIKTFENQGQLNHVILPYDSLPEMYVYLNNCAVLCSTQYFCPIEYISREWKYI
jgi:hypothetical protein